MLNKKFYLLIFNFALIFCEPKIATIAHLSSIGNNNHNFLENSKLIKTYGKQKLEEYSVIINEIINQEKKQSDFYVFYHGCSNLTYALQDVITEFYKLKTNKKLPDDFQGFLRIPHNKKFDKFKNINDFFEHEINTRVQVSDFIPEVATYLLSANLALFGNITSPFESSFYIFINNIPATTMLDWQNTIIKEVLENFGLKSSVQNVQKIFDLSQFISKKGAIIQIFIPKKEVSKYAYLARNYGRPYGSSEAMQILFDKTNKTKRLSKFWKLLESNPAAALETCTDNISNILEQYRNLPESNLKNFDGLQARILISNNFLLNPNSGVKIYRYNGYNNNNILDQATFKSYNDQLKKTTKDIFENA